MVVHHNINLLYLYIVLASFLWKKDLMQSGCNSAPPLNIHYLMSTKPGSGVEASMSCYSSNKPARYMAQAFHISLIVNVHGLPGTRMRGCSFQFVKIPPLSAFWIGNTQLTHTGNASLSSDLVYSALLKSCFDTFTVFLPLSSFLWHAQSALNN